jgi:GxxExxY protein
MRVKREDVNLLSNRIIGGAARVLTELGAGFLETVYENALAHELGKSGLSVARRYRMAVRYDGVEVGEYVADMLVEDKILVDLRAARAINDSHRAQCVNYLKASGLHLCLLLNFGRPRLEFKRVMLTH